MKLLNGLRFGELRVLSYSHTERRDAGTRKRVYHHWFCQCRCGEIKAIRGSDLTIGHTVSCGCVGRSQLGAITRTHGKTGTEEYRIWTDMWSRCTNPNRTCYVSYGGRGIGVCDEWKSFEIFISDMGARPSRKHSIERKDNSAGYCAGNCFWATSETQANNKRNNVRIEFNGQTRTLAQWANETGISADCLSQRRLAGWDTARLLTEPIGMSKGRI